MPLFGVGEGGLMPLFSVGEGRPHAPLQCRRGGLMPSSVWERGPHALFSVGEGASRPHAPPQCGRGGMRPETYVEEIYVFQYCGFLCMNLCLKMNLSLHLFTH